MESRRPDLPSSRSSERPRCVIVYYLLHWSESSDVEVALKFMRRSFRMSDIKLGQAVCLLSSAFYRLLVAVALLTACCLIHSPHPSPGWVSSKCPVLSRVGGGVNSYPSQARCCCIISRSEELAEETSASLCACGFAPGQGES